MKRLLKISLYLLLAAFLTIAGVALYFSARIKPLLIGQLNAQLQVPVQVDDIQLSSFAHFPRLGVSFNNVVIAESSEYYGAPLVEAKSLDLYVNLYRLLQKKYIIGGVTVSGATLRLAHLDNGSNFELFKPTEDSDGSVDFAIRKLILKNCRVVYAHKNSHFLMDSRLRKVRASLDYRPDRTDIALKGQLMVDSMVQEGVSYMHRQHLRVHTALTFTEDYGHMEIAPSECHLGRILLHTQGDVRIGNSTDLHITFENEEADLDEVRSVLPRWMAASLDHLDLSGKLVLRGELTGSVDETHNPSFGFTYTLEQGTIGSKDGKASLADIRSKGSLKIPDMGDLSSAWVQAQLLNLRSGSHRMVGDLHIENFDRPLIKWAGDAALDAHTLSRLVNSQDITIDKGDLFVKGELELRYDLERDEVVPNSFHYLGSVQLNGAAFQLSEPNLKVDRADVEIRADERNVVIRKCRVDYGNSELDLKGYILNASQLFDARSDAEITGKLYWKGLNLNDFIGVDSSSSEETDQLLPFKLTIQTELEQFSFNNFRAERIRGTLYGKPMSIHIPDAQITALDGQADANIRFTRNGEGYLLDIASRMSKINITQLFAQFDEFGQEEITSKHLSGSLSGTLLTKLVFNSSLQPQTDKLYAKADVEIVDGQLIRYEPLKALSAFVQVKELENVRFTSLRNTIEIFDRTIFIPRMFIGNSALSIDLEGTHTFDNYMDYHLSVNLAELLANRTNWRNQPRESIQIRERGGLTAHIHMKGTPEDLQISYDQVAMRRVIREEIRQERQTLRQILNGQEVEEEVSDTYYENLWDE